MSKKPKLLQIDSCLGVLSTGRISEGIAKVAIANGWECYIAHGARYVGKTIQSSYRIETKLGEYIHYAKSLLFDAHGLGSKTATKNLIKFIEAIKPDVIQLHCIHGYYLNYSLLFRYLAESNIPVVWTLHDCWAFTGHCAHFCSVDCYKWKKECKECPLYRQYPKALVDKSNRNYNFKKELFTSIPRMTIISVSKWLDSVVNDSFLSIYPHKVIYNGIDTDEFRPYDEMVFEKYGITTPHYLLAVSSAWSTRKGLNDYIELSKILPVDYSILLVGVKDNMRKNLPEKIVAIPRTDDKQELAMLYSKADFVTSLSYAETMGLTIVEGMSCGTPVIVYNNTGQTELVSDEVGFVIKTGDFKEIFNIINAKRVESEEKRKQIKAACVHRAKTYYSETCQYNKYLEVYNGMILNNI